MDTGEYETNALVINNISSVSFAFYEPASPTPAFFGPSAIEVETLLRNDGYLPYLDSARRGVWCFRLAQRNRNQASQTEAPSFPKTVECGAYMLSLSDEGAFEPASLVKSRMHVQNATNTPTSSSSNGSVVSDPKNPQSTGFPSHPNPATDQDPRSLVPVESKPPSAFSIKDTHEYFVAAALSAISCNFCARTGAIPLTSRTLLLPRASQSEYGASPAILASLRVYLTTTGSLVVSMSHTFAENLISLSDNFGNQIPPLGLTVLAAPLGLFATCHATAMTETVTTTEGSFGQSPDSQVLRPRSERDDGPWRSACSKLLQSRHIPSSFNVSPSQKWVGLHRMRRKVSEQSADGRRTPMVCASSVSWPANLCFCKMFSKLAVKSEAEDLHIPQPDQNFDPLKVAKTWFLSTSERDEILAKKKKEREAAAAQDTLLTNGHIQNASGLSPLTLRPSGAAGVPAGGMYPTPPAGGQTLVGATPTMDGTVSSPGNNATMTANSNVEARPSVPGEAFSENWGNAEAKRERTGNSFESENLFGELGPDMFGDNDITEADFNFFDEQPGGMDLDALDIPDITHTDANLGLDLGLISAPEPQIKPEHTEPQVPGVPLSPVFTKPELRHARSSLVDEARQQAKPNAGQHENSGVKRQASPFNPDTVYKRIRASLDNHKSTRHNSRIYPSNHGSIFEKVDFGPSLSIVNSKYEGSGRFDYSADRSRVPTVPKLDEPPTTDYLRRHGKNRKGLKELPTTGSELFARMCNAQESTSNRPSPQNAEASHSDADEMSLLSDQDDSSYDSDEPTSPVKSLGFRRPRNDDDGDSLATSLKDLESVDAAPSPYLPLELPRTTKSEVDLPLAKYFADPEPPWVQYSLPDDQLIMAAQILTDQLSTSTFPFSTTSHISLQSKVDLRRQLSHVARDSMQELQAVLPLYLGAPTECQFRPFIEVQDVPLIGQPTRIQPRPPGTDQMRPSNLFQIPSPHFEMRRYESKLSVLPSAVSFWESLGLSPSPGGKDINAICIFPDYEGLVDDMLVFTDRMRSIYESLKLGSFNRLPTTSNVENGLFKFDVERDLVSVGKPTSFLGPSLQNCASKVCKALSSLITEQTNFVVFFVYSPDIAGSIVECCAVFNEIFEGYRRVLSNKKLPVANDLALQLISQDFVASSSSVAMPSPMDFARLALETYDRCTQLGADMPSPAIVLEQPPPRMIDFKLTVNPSASLMHENTCLHIAYAQSVDERWVAAAWTDNRGNQQMTASYCLGRKGKAIVTPLADVTREIWSTTQELISAWRVHWRIIVAKCGVMDSSEIELWSSLAQTESKASVTLTLVAVDTDPSIQLLPPIVKVPNSAPSVFYTTPVSTPQASMVSPEQSGNPSTPMRENAVTSAPTPGGDNSAADSDADATLADLTDQTWGAVLSHRLNNSTSLTELNPALVSGYLVKRGGTRVEDPPVVLEVNIVYSEGNPRAYESLLREMLVYYRGLGTLARARGMVDKETDVRPWHIAAAEKGVRALYMLM
ncbi:mediator complex subunit 13 C-terminal-domain-containing protein [Biscogniauxia mediterranea]|nr:mediator complex subunit 13 C-terminal-domain-containing protein [Biscogniauxia mediterranea]